MLKKWLILNAYIEPKKSKDPNKIIKKVRNNSDGQGFQVGESFYKVDGTRSKGPIR